MAFPVKATETLAKISNRMKEIQRLLVNRKET